MSETYRHRFSTVNESLKFAFLSRHQFFRTTSIINIWIKSKQYIVFSKEASRLKIEHIIIILIKTFDISIINHVKMFELPVFSEVEERLRANNISWISTYNRFVKWIIILLEIIKQFINDVIRNLIGSVLWNLIMKKMIVELFLKPAKAL